MNSSLIDSEFWQDRYDKTDYSKWLPLIEEKRKQTEGNYDGIFGVVSNFSWTFNNDGSYDVKIEIISLGDVIESLKVNLPPLGDGAPSAYLSNKQQALADKVASGDLNAVDIDTFYTTVYPDLEKDLKNYWDNEQSSPNPFFITFDPITQISLSSGEQQKQTNFSTIYSPTTPLPSKIEEGTMKLAMQAIFNGKQKDKSYSILFNDFEDGFNSLPQIIDTNGKTIPNTKTELLKYLNITSPQIAANIKDTLTNRELVQTIYLLSPNSPIFFKNILFNTFKKAVYQAYIYEKQDGNE
jgi:hypothetical protein